MADDYLNRALSRRRLLKLAGGGLAAAGLAPVLAACGGGDEGGDTAAATTAADTGAAAGGTTAAPPTGGGEISMWWWGEQEAIGIQKWVDSTLAGFTEQSGVAVDPLLMDTSAVIPQFTEAAAAGEPPDVQFVFNGIYHMENVWLGYIQALNGLVPDTVLQESGATVLSVYQGEQFRVGWYIVGFGIEYDKAAFESAGLDPESPPTTWDAFLDACDKIKGAGLIPFSAGVKDGFFGEWFFVNTLTQALDNPSQAIDLFIGDLDWTDPQYYEQWSKLQELVENGFINEDANSLELYQGIQLMETGKAAMTHQHDGFAAGRAGEARRERRLLRHAGVRHRLHGRHPDHGYPGLLHPDRRQGSDVRCGAPRVHALRGARQRDVDRVAGAPGGREVRRIAGR